MLEDRRPNPLPRRSWWRRYGIALFLVGLLGSAGAVVLTAAFLADETARAYGGGFDQAQWREPELASLASIPGIPGAPAILTDALSTPSGRVSVSVQPDGTVTMRPLDDGVLWPDAKQAFQAWAGRHGVEPTYEGMRLVADGKLIPKEHALAA